jgi:hypothetical protein
VNPILETASRSSAVSCSSKPPPAFRSTCRCGIPFEERVVGRSSPWDIGAAELLATCSAEDLVVLKAFAGRDKDWLDVEGVVTRQGPALDAALVLAEAGPLLELKEAAAAMERLRRLLGERRS